MISGSIARRYAKALLGIAIEQRAHEKFRSELEQFATMYTSNVEFKNAMDNAIFPLSQRQSVIQTLAQKLSLSKPVTNLAEMLLARGKFSYFPMILKEFQTLSDRHMGRIRGKLTTVSKVDVTTELRIQTALEKISSQKVVLDKQEDPSLLGGFVLQLGDVVYDGSIISQLQHLRQRLSGEENSLLPSQES